MTSYELYQTSQHICILHMHYIKKIVILCHVLLFISKFYNNAKNITLRLSTNSRTTKDEQGITKKKSFELDDDFVVLLKQILHVVKFNYISRLRCKRWSIYIMHFIYMLTALHPASSCRNRIKH